MILREPEIYYAAVCLVMVCSSLFCALVRYFHLCRPFDEHEEYFYPARKLITFVYACFAMPAVWLFRMDSPDAWLFVQVFLVLFLPGAAVISFRRFFFYEKKHRLPVFFIVGIMPFLFITVLWIFAWMGGDVLYSHRGVLMPAIGVYSIFILFELFHVTIWLYRQVRKRNMEEYSSEDDFPVRFAGFVMFLPLFFIIVSWGLFISGSRCYNMFLQIFISVTNLVILLKILHPQRSGLRNVVEDAGRVIAEKMEDMVSPVQEDGCTDDGVIPAVVKDELEKKIRTILVGQKLYLNPNLKLADIADAVESNRKYVSVVMNERFGSFYAEVNRLRIEAAIRYKERHPSASREEIAVNSGFSNVKTYSRNLKLYSKKI